MLAVSPTTWDENTSAQHSATSFHDEFTDARKEGDGDVDICSQMEVVIQNQLHKARMDFSKARRKAQLKSRTHGAKDVADIAESVSASSSSSDGEAKDPDAAEVSSSSVPDEELFSSTPPRAE